MGLKLPIGNHKNLFLSGIAFTKKKMFKANGLEGSIGLTHD